MKHTLCDLQEKIFHLQIQLLEEDIAGGETGRLTRHHWDSGGATTPHLKESLALQRLLVITPAALPAGRYRCTCLPH